MHIILIIYKLLVIGGITTLSVVIFVLVLNTQIISDNYSILVDPFKDPQDLFVMSRVLVENIGNKPLTNVKINFGNEQIEKLGTLVPGQKILVSPPSSSDMSFVIVTSDEGIYVKKYYRTPSKMPGMMGS